jgi:5-(carboxyamino)imidazole ribonucleotide synthase
VSQDRLTEKDFLAGIGLKTAPYRNVETEADLPAALAGLGVPAILKTRRMGYDGKGQIRFSSADQRDWTGAPSVLEGFVEFSAEISVIVARGADGQVAAYDPGLNVHREGILRTTTVPCGLPGTLLTDAVLMAAKIVNALDYIGVMGVELFVTPQGLVVNEIAPRVHNSGHWTQAGCAVDQFEQHIRAVAGLPLGDGQRYADVEMENLIGDDMARLPDLLRQPRVQVHLYGKGAARPGRKMGHVNRLL